MHVVQPLGSLYALDVEAGACTFVDFGVNVLTRFVTKESVSGVGLGADALVESSGIDIRGTVESGGGRMAQGRISGRSSTNPWSVDASCHKYSQFMLTGKTDSIRTTCRMDIWKFKLMRRHG